MEINTNISGKTATVSPVGTIDTRTAKEFQEALVAVDADKKLVVDFADVAYITSAGLRAVVVARKKFSGDKMEIINVNQVTYNVFNVTGMIDMITIKLKEESNDDLLSMSFKELLANNLRKMGDRVAISANGHEYTWKEIDGCASAVASDLRKIGVGKGSHVGIMGSNSVNWIITFFAVQKLGGISMFVNNNLLASEVQDISSIGEISHLCVGDFSAREKDPDFMSKVVDPAKSNIREIYDIKSSIDLLSRKDEAAESEAVFNETVFADDPALVIFTSGSTGKPKAVLLSAYNMINSAMSMGSNLHQDSSDIKLLNVPLFHTFGFNVWLSSVIAGGKIVIPSDNHISTVLNVIEQEKITSLHLVPTLALALVGNKEFSSERVSTVRYLGLAGAAATEPQARMLIEKFKNAHLGIAYGLSEMAPACMTEFDDTVEHITGTIGKPIRNISVRIEDTESKAECPVGVSGEILLKGFNTMVCYYKLSLEDQPLDEDGWLHTGDLGYIDEDGYVHLVGRSKDLIIRGGENIAPGEVQNAVSEFPGIRDVKVQGIPDDFYGELVGASIVLDKGVSFDEQAMREHLASKLAKYKIPAYFIVYDEFPLLANGKVDGVNLKKDMNAKVAAIRSEK